MANAAVVVKAEIRTESAISLAHSQYDTNAFPVGIIAARTVGGLGGAWLGHHLQTIMDVVADCPDARPTASAGPKCDQAKSESFCVSQ